MEEHGHAVESESSFAPSDELYAFRLEDRYEVVSPVAQGLVVAGWARHDRMA
jgi:hypothetical protein